MKVYTNGWWILGTVIRNERKIILVLILLFIILLWYFYLSLLIVGTISGRNILLIRLLFLCLIFLIRGFNSGRHHFINVLILEGRVIGYSFHFLIYVIDVLQLNLGLFIFEVFSSHIGDHIKHMIVSNFLGIFFILIFWNLLWNLLFLNCLRFLLLIMYDLESPKERIFNCSGIFVLVKILSFN